LIWVRYVTKNKNKISNFYPSAQNLTSEDAVPKEHKLIVKFRLCYFLLYNLQKQYIPAHP